MRDIRRLHALFRARSTTSPPVDPARRRTQPHAEGTAFAMLRDTPAREETGGSMDYLEMSAHMTVRPGCLEGFKKQAAECIRITREKDTRTLRYDWFLSSDGTKCEVREAYTGPEGLIEHNRNILEARTTLFRDYADGHFMTVYGDPSKPQLDLLNAHGVGHTWFTFLQGLEPSPRIPSLVLEPERAAGHRG
jgi:quinol monooxygenase YgiN